MPKAFLGNVVLFLAMFKYGYRILWQAFIQLLPLKALPISTLSILFYFLASGMLPEEISLTSTPKRSSIPQAMSTPAPVSMNESVETVEAKAALKQVFFSVNTVENYHGFHFCKHFNIYSVM